MTKYFCRFFLCLILVFTLSAGGNRLANAADSALPNGIYLVLRDAAAASLLKPTDAGESILIDDGHLLEPNVPGVPEKPRYLVLSTSQFIPMNLAEKPTKKTDERGKKQLLLELAQNQVVPLETFTRTNCGRSVAFVIGNQVVTVHKVREPIVGGKIQITRCTDNGCDVLYSQLEQ